MIICSSEHFHRILHVSLVFRLRLQLLCRSNNLFELDFNLEKCYRILALKFQDKSVSKTQLKNQYLSLARLYHPDSQLQPDAERFREITDAYKYIVEHVYNEQDKQDLLQDIPVESQFDIRHTAPQHRQYLEFEGIGSGTPSERQKQFQQYRVQRANENVREFAYKRLSSQQSAWEGEHGELIHSHEEARYARRVRTSNLIERLVEDLIQESMQRGDFDNLPGAGHPLKQDPSEYNPYLDSMTHRLNRILVQNGYSPEWVMLEKDIRSEVDRIRKFLLENRLKIYDSKHKEADESSICKRWLKIVEEATADMECLNRAVDRFNLMCPVLSKQMFHYRIDKEIKKAIDAVVDVQAQKADNLVSAQKNCDVEVGEIVSPAKLDSTAAGIEENKGVLKSLLRLLQRSAV